MKVLIDIFLFVEVSSSWNGSIFEQLPDFSW